MATIQSVQTFGRKKTAVAVAYCKQSKEGKGLIKLNGSPIEHVKPEELKLKVLEPILLLGKDRYGSVRSGRHGRDAWRPARVWRWTRTHQRVCSSSSCGSISEGSPEK